jgi:hypothetical protein
LNPIRTASTSIRSGRYADARLFLNQALDKLNDLLHQQSPKLFPAILAAELSSIPEQSPLRVWDLFFKHAADLCKIRLRVRHPITEIMRI